MSCPYIGSNGNLFHASYTNMIFGALATHSHRAHKIYSDIVGFTWKSYSPTCWWSKLAAVEDGATLFTKATYTLGDGSLAFSAYDELLKCD